MARELAGKRIVFMLADSGEQVGLIRNPDDLRAFTTAAVDASAKA